MHRASTFAALLAGLALPCGATDAADPQYTYLALGDSIPAASGGGSAGHIDVVSYSWGPPTTIGSLPQVFVKSWATSGDADAPPAGADINNLKTSSINPEAKLPGKRTPPTVTLKRGRNNAGGGDPDRPVIAGTVPNPTSPLPPELPVMASIVESAPSGQATGKRQHKPMGLVRPRDRGSLTVQGSLPGCAVGTRYPDAVLQTAAARYALKNVTITGCTAGGVSLNYIKVQEVTIKKAAD